MTRAPAASHNQDGWEEWALVLSSLRGYGSTCLQRDDRGSVSACGMEPVPYGTASQPGSDGAGCMETEAMASVKQARIGMMGLGVMGQNLALNFERNGFPVAVWARRAEATAEFTHRHSDKEILQARSPQELVAKLERPRKLFLLVKAGDAVDWTIEQVKPHLDPGDIIIDGGNSHYRDTRRREQFLSAAGFHFIGTGVSGGEHGALWGPSLMPGGKPEAYAKLRRMFEAVAAKVDDEPCVTHIGPGGSGHFVKMVHNGIEYGDMQLIAEAYDILRRVAGMEAAELAGLFGEWNRGPLESYLVEVTSRILSVVDDETGRPLVDLILDKADQKGTGGWASAAALELGVALPTIHAAITARVLSSLKDERVEAESLIRGPSPAQYTGDRGELITAVHDALHAGRICTYAQGMALIRSGARQFGWEIDLREVTRIWRGGCIIRARILEPIRRAYLDNPELANLLLDPEFLKTLSEAQPRWRRVAVLAQESGIPVPAIAASLSYFDSYRTGSLPQNLTQAQRDFFGAHLYQRVDRPDAEPVHTDWDSAAPGGES